MCSSFWIEKGKTNVIYEQAIIKQQITIKL